MGLVENQFTALNSKMRISSSSTPSHSCCPWLMLVLVSNSITYTYSTQESRLIVLQVPMALNFLLPQSQHPTWMVSTQCLAKFSVASQQFVKLRSSLLKAPTSQPRMLPLQIAANSQVRRRTKLLSRALISMVTLMRSFLKIWIRNSPSRKF